MQTAFPRYVTIEIKDIVIDIIGRLISLVATTLPFIWYYAGAPAAGNKLFAAVTAIVLVSFLLLGICMTARCTHRLISLYCSSVRGIPKVILLLLCIVAPIPVLEIWYLLKDRNSNVCVPAFLQPEANGTNSIFTSIQCLLSGLPEIDSKILAEEIRRNRYFASAEDSMDPAVVITTTRGEFLCLIKSGGIYMFSIFVLPKEYSPTDDRWRLEVTADGSESALVFAYAYDLFDKEKDVATIICDALDVLLEELKPYTTPEVTL